METQTETKPSDEQRSGSLFKTGGHDLISRKPVFTSDSKYLLISSGNDLRRYVVETGSFITSHHFGHQNHIISAQLMTQNSDEVMITSNDGLVIVWNLSEDRKVNEFNIKINTSFETIIWCQLVSNYFYFTTILSKDSNDSKCQIYYCPKNLDQQKSLIERSNEVNPTSNSVAFCPTSDPRYCVAIHESVLYVYGIPRKPKSVIKRHWIQSDKQFTCIACHPMDEMIATGDSLGRIIIWHDFVENNYPTRAILHWHQLPVADLCLSPEGTSLYSVGAEMTLIRWDISGNHFGEKNFMPRLGMPIRYVTIDDNQHMIVTSHEDNTIQILGPQMKGIKCVIEGMSRGVGSDYDLSTGLLWNKKMNSITLNGRTGHLQFFSPSFQKQLFQLDVVQQNLISSTRDHKVFPIEVTKADVSEDGVWLSSVEMRNDFETLPEIRLKFWKLKETLKNYSLNTTIHLPHKSDINCIKFAPNCQSMVSTSCDKEFKVWHLVEDDDKQWWKCFKVGNLNSVFTPSIANWSSDSSLLAIAYNSFLTLWEVSNNSVLKYVTKLSVEEKTDSKVIFVDFGYEDKSHYLIEGRNFFIKVWNLLDLSLLWKHQTYEPILCIAFNKWENKVAIGLTKMITFFGLNSDTPIGSIDVKPREEPIISALFSDEKSDNSLDSNCRPLLERTKFYCMNERHELFVFGQNDRQFVKTEVMQWNTGDILSPIALMLINKKERKETPNNDDFELYLKTNTSVNKLVDEMFFTVPSHVLPPISILCKTFLTSLNKCRQKEELKDDTDFKIPSDLEIKPLLLANNYGISSDIESHSTYLDTNEREIEVKNMIIEDQNEEQIDNIEEEDYSWLKQLDLTDN